jgi:diacylglycerol kinase family enzyme
LARKLGDHGVVAAPRSLDELARVAEDFRRQRIEVLGIAGGDGTNYVTLTGFAQVYGAEPLPTVALLRGGTMNTVANSLGLPKGRTDGLLDRLVLRYLETPALPCVEQWTMEVDGKLAFLFGLGVVPAFLHEYYATGAPSPWTAVKTLARGIGSAVIQGAMVRRMTRPVDVEVVTDTGEKWPMQPFFSVAAGTIEDIGLGFRPFHRAHEVRGAFHLLGIRTNAMGFVTDLPRIHRALPMSEGKSVDAIVRRAVITSRDETMRYMIDGDIVDHPNNQLTIALGPAVRIATMN